MPLYVYQCPSCKKSCEILQKRGEEPPFCTCNDKTVMKKQLSQTGGFILKGSGWFRDGYSSKKGKKE